MRTFVPRFRARRFYDCLYYPQCLDRAARSFAYNLPCRTCPRYTPGEVITDHKEFFGILHLLQVVFQGDEN